MASLTYTIRTLSGLWLFAGTLTAALSDRDFGPQNYSPLPLAPWGLTVPTFDAFVTNHSNATGAFPIPGINISAPYSTSSGHTIDGWSWSVSVTADIPLANSSKPAQQGQTGYYTGTEVSLSAPATLLGTGNSSHNLTVDDSWEVCVMQWDLPVNGYNYTDSLRTDNGSCLSTLSSQCVSDIQDRVAAKYSSLGCRCPDPQLIPSCNGTTASKSVFVANCIAEKYDSTSIRRYWPDGRLVTRRFGGNPHSMGDIGAYNLTGSLAWPVMVAWSRGYGPPGVALPVANTTAQLSCVRAKTATPGSTAPGWNSTSNAQKVGFVGSDLKSFCVTLTLLITIWNVVF